MNKCMTVPRAGRGKERLAQIEMDAPLYSRPALIGDALYLVTAHRLYLIAAKRTMVEPTGIEPATFSLRTRRSTN
jgi:hypothetical protein